MNRHSCTQVSADWSGPGNTYAKDNGTYLSLQTSDGLRTVTFAYADSDNPLNVTSVTDDLSNTVATEYDILDRVTKVTDALGYFTEYVYVDGVMTTADPGRATGRALPPKRPG